MRPDQWTRRRFLVAAGSVAVAGLVPSDTRAASTTQPADTYASKRPPRAARKFNSDAVAEEIARVQQLIADPELSWVFGNCFANTLDTTVQTGRDDTGREDTFIVTGDIDAMWLRDSTNQVWPYVPLAKSDPALAGLFRGLIHRQAACVRLDPYANAFYRDVTRISPWIHDLTDMRPGVHERKYELDSLCSVLRLSHGYWAATADASAFDEDWRAAVELIVHTITTEQCGSNDAPGSPYHFARRTERATDTLPLTGGHCYPWQRTGLSRSPFRPSDDACQFPLSTAANAMAVVTLRNVSAMLIAIHRFPELATGAARLADQIDAAIGRHCVVQHPTRGSIYAFEIDGFGSVLLMDDANVPSLLSLPYLGYCPVDDALYQRTRAFALSTENPYYTAGTALAGIGGPHVGPGWIWPIAITMQALTSADEGEILRCLRTLKSTTAGTGFMHESIWKDDASRFTRKWFAWANALFGELVVKIAADHVGLLARV